MLQDEYEESGVLPPALANRPALQKHLKYYWDAFWELQAGRQYTEKGFPQALTWSDRASYIQIRQISSPLVRAALLEHLKTLDSTYVEHIRARLTKQMEAAMKAKRS